MNFSLNNENKEQLHSLTKHLKINQVIQVSIIKKIDINQYLIDFKGICLTAISEIDLLGKYVFVKIVQINPYLKLKAIINEKNAEFSEYYRYIEEHNLNYQDIPEEFINNKNFNSLKPDLLYKFIKTFHYKYTNSFINASFLLKIFNSNSQNNNEFLERLINFYNYRLIDESIDLPDDCSICKYLDQYQKLSDKLKKSNKKNNLNLYSILEFSDLFNKFVFDNYIEIGLLHSVYKKLLLQIPVELRLSKDISQTLMVSGLLNTKHFDCIAFVFHNRELNLLFENITLLNFVSKYLNSIDTINSSSLSVKYGVQNDRYQFHILKDFNEISSRDINFLGMCLCEIIKKDLELE